jgi:dynein heavy chain
MALLERHRFMIGRLADAFSRDENTIERMVLQPEVIRDIDNFFSADGPTKILITMELIPEPIHVPNSGRSQQERDDAPPFFDEENESEENGEESTVIEPLTHMLRVFTDDIDTVPNTTVFFMKNKRPRDGAIRYAIDPAKSNDGALSFGVLQAPLESLEVMMRCLYKPLVATLPSDSWGQASTEQKGELLGSIDNFTKGLQESIRSISGGLELKKPDEKLESLGANAANDPVLVTQALNLLQEWCIRIERYLDDSDRSKWETPDSGPDTEILYWRNRMQR